MIRNFNVEVHTLSKAIGRDSFSIGVGRLDVDEFEAEEDMIDALRS